MFVDLQHISNDGDFSNHSDDEFIAGEEGKLTLVALPLQMRVSFLWMVLEEPMRIQVQMCQWRKLWLI